MKMALPGGTPTQVLPNASLAALSPDGQRMLFGDTTQQSHLYSALLDGSDVTLVADVRGTHATYSPDGNQLAFLVDDATMPCQHVEVVASDGSQAGTPTRIRDCTQTGEFITALAWIDVP